MDIGRDKYTSLILTDIVGDKYTSLNLTDIWGGGQIHQFKFDWQISLVKLPPPPLPPRLLCPSSSLVPRGRPLLQLGGGGSWYLSPAFFGGLPLPLFGCPPALLFLLSSLFLAGMGSGTLATMRRLSITNPINLNLSQSSANETVKSLYTRTN